MISFDLELIAGEMSINSLDNYFIILCKLSTFFFTQIYNFSLIFFKIKTDEISKGYIHQV